MNKLKKGTGPKNAKLRGIAKLDDANNAGGKAGKDCTLIVTEGDSAKALAISGLGVVGRDNYGVFPLRGKLLNARDASHKQVCYSMFVSTRSFERVQKLYMYILQITVSPKTEL